jgi:hypothetical protein
VTEQPGREACVSDKADVGATAHPAGGACRKPRARQAYHLSARSRRWRPPLAARSPADRRARTCALTCCRTPCVRTAETCFA